MKIACIHGYTCAYQSGFVWFAIYTSFHNVKNKFWRIAFRIISSKKEEKHKAITIYIVVVYSLSTFFLYLSMIQTVMYAIKTIPRIIIPRKTGMYFVVLYSILCQLFCVVLLLSFSGKYNRIKLTRFYQFANI